MPIILKNEVINITEIVDAEEYFIKKFRSEGWECQRTYECHCNNHKVTEFLKTETRNGIPDLIVFNNEKFFFVEVKKNNGGIRKAQSEWINNHPQIDVIVYFITQKLLEEEIINDSYREKIFSEISKKISIRATKPEYQIILDTLQEISSTTKQDLLQEINNKYEHPIFTYKQLYDQLTILINLNVIESDDFTKEISINPEYISYPENLPISSYCIGIFAISAILLIASMATQTWIAVTLTMFITGLLYLIAQHYGSKFECFVLTSPY